jgi:hypothetical protein
VLPVGGYDQGGWRSRFGGPRHPRTAYQHGRTQTQKLSSIELLHGGLLTFAQMPVEELHDHVENLA